MSPCVQTVKDADTPTEYLSVLRSLVEDMTEHAVTEQLKESLVSMALQCPSSLVLVHCSGPVWCVCISGVPDSIRVAVSRISAPIPRELDLAASWPRDHSRIEHRHGRWLRRRRSYGHGCVDWDNRLAGYVSCHAVLLSSSFSDIFCVNRFAQILNRTLDILHGMLKKAPGTFRYEEH